MCERFEADARLYATDNGPPCLTCKTSPGIWVYRLSWDDPNTASQCAGHAFAQCATCHAIEDVYLTDGATTIATLKRMHLVERQRREAAK